MSATPYTLFLRDPDDDSAESELARLTIDGGQIALIDTAPGCLSFVNEVLAEIDERDGVVVKVAGQGRTSLVARRYGRNDPDFLEGLERWLSARYGVELRGPDALRPENVPAL